MLQNYSKEQLARIIGVAVIVLGFFGYNSVDAGGVIESVDAIIVNSVLLFGVAVDIYGYFRRYLVKKDVTVSGKYKN